MFVREIAPSRSDEILQLCSAPGGGRLVPATASIASTTASSTAANYSSASGGTVSACRIVVPAGMPPGTSVESVGGSELSVAPVLAPTQPGPGTELTALERLAAQIEDAAAQANLPLVKNRLQELLQRCSLSRATCTRQRQKPQNPVEEDGVTTRASAVGGLSYRPEFMLYFVLLADKLRLGSAPEH